MDKFDLFLNYLKEDYVPSDYSSFINNVIESLPNKVVKKSNISKKLSIAAGILIIFSSVAYAGTKLYENIMHNPKEKTLKSYTVTEEEKENFKISENDAIEIGIKYIKELVGVDVEPNILDLKDNDNELNNYPVYFSRGISDYNDLFFTIFYRDLNSTPYTGNQYIVEIDEYGKLRRFTHNIQSSIEDMQMLGLTAIEARSEAEDVFKKYLKEYNYDNYELTFFGRGASIGDAGCDNNDKYVTQWNAYFVRSYDGLLDDNDFIRIGFMPTTLELEMLEISKNSKYENNELIITKEQAIEIAKKEDILIENQKKINEIQCDLRINTMNSNVYLREKYKEQFESRQINNETMMEIDKTGQISNVKVFTTEERTRKTWQVCIIYDYDGDGIKEFTYYIDATTGEIIGGNLFNDFYFEEFYKDANNNYAYK